VKNDQREQALSRGDLDPGTESGAGELTRAMMAAEEVRERIQA
jgi:hypothetical protein